MPAITRSRLAEIVAEEVRLRIRQLVEFSAEDDGGSRPKKKKGKSPGIGSADSEDTRKGPTPDGVGGDVERDAPDPNSPDPGKVDPEQDADPGGASVDGDQPDPEADQDDGHSERDAEDAIDPEGDGGEEPSGAINDEVSGKTVQAVTIEPKSKVLPGAKAIVIAFNETTDPLQILVTETGRVVFLWRGQLHDMP